MTDYTRGTGNSGTMLIRDFFPGSNAIELWITSNNTTTWSDHLPWGYTINGVTWNGQYNYQPGAGWRRLGVFNVNYSQNVTFRLGATGTSGFGGPTTFTVWLTRQTVPPAPTTPTLSNITSSSIQVVFHSQGDGQSPILEWQIGYGTDPNNPQSFWSSTGTSTVTGLTSGLTYYFWARGRNALGWGPWSGRASATTLRVPDPPNPPVASNITQVYVTLTWTANGNGGDPITLHQVGWSTSPTGNPTNSVTVNSPATLNSYSPATTYYFRTRVRNSVGWSAWSAATTVRTIAGARIRVGAVYKEAIPYVKVGGVWVVARPWVRSAGVWKESQ